MQLGTCLRPNIHQYGPEILGVQFYYTLVYHQITVQVYDNTNTPCLVAYGHSGIRSKFLRDLILYILDSFCGHWYFSMLHSCPEQFPLLG
jgi:hypothetical protein